jgi:acetoacetyl-[acyl-carrier protein] synthase
MLKLPVIVGLGGINSAGRSSGFHAYKRVICDALKPQDLENTWRDLAHRMQITLPDDKLTTDVIEKIKAGTLVRKIENFDPENIRTYHTVQNKTLATPFSLTLLKTALPDPLPFTWQVKNLDEKTVEVHLSAESEILLPTVSVLDTFAGSNIPSNFEPGLLYPSTHHPRSLRLAVYGASDALNSLGIEWQSLLEQIDPDQISVYAGGALTQADPLSLTGLVSQFVLGRSFNSKMMAFSFSEMAADFINSYIIHSVGTTGTSVGACATFLFNLKQGIYDIQQGRAQVAIVGCAEAAITPEVISAFSQMKALASNKKLAALDGQAKPNYRRACRPFSSNAGFILAESAQFVVLMSDELALKTGANILGSVPDVFVNADANKKSITAPGVGNYITMMKATALTKTILGGSGLEQTYVQAHGSGTPQNRTTESHILNEVAKAFHLKNWAVSAIKSYVGHSVSAAAGDQLSMALGVWTAGYVPGIKTIDHIAEDVHHSHLNILMDHQFVGEQGKDMLATIINSKGFGGNNASAVILSPEQTQKMLEKKYGKAMMKTYHQKNEAVREKSLHEDKQAVKGLEKITYEFGTHMMDEACVTLSQDSVKLSEFSRQISLPKKSGYEDYLE